MAISTCVYTIYLAIYLFSFLSICLCFYLLSIPLSVHTSMQVATWATEAFFMHGGEPHFTFPTTVGPTSQPLGGMSPATPTMAQYPSSYPPSTPTSTPSLTAPHIIGPSSAVATPPASHFSPAAPLQYGTPGGLGKALFGPEAQLSGKHNGLCLYLARLLG